MMKLASSAVLCFAVAVASASASASSAVDPVVVLEDLTPHSISATSPLGQRLLSEARSLENNNNNYNNNNLFSNNWIADYSLHFEGCHHVSQWNTEVDGEDDVRISTKRLVKFRLCPTGKCNTNSGCNSGYGDYIIDMETFLEAWMESKAIYQSFKCDYLKDYVCGCQDGNENYSVDMCLYDCYSSHNMGSTSTGAGCMDYNPYGDAESNNAFSVSDYVTCSQVDMTYQQQQAQEGQEDQDGQQQQQQGQGQQYFNYYVGPYCANQGGSIFLGLFTDDSCTTFADASGGRETYFQYKYTNLPYSSTNIVDMDCLSCKEPTENNADGNDAEDTDTVMEACESIYTTAGKCEAALPYGTAYAPNSNACKYIEGIKILRQDGTTVSSSSQAKANKTASVFIGIFSTSFVLLSAYVYYLKTKLDRASINIAE